MAINARPRARSLQVVPATDGSVRIRHREYIDDAIGGSNFTTMTFALQPGAVSTFPWLSRIATLFDSYILHSVQFEYEPSVPTTTGGIVMLTFDPDPINAAPTDKGAMLGYSCLVRTSPWSSCKLNLPASRFKTLGTQKYVRSGVVVPSAALPDYDAGTLFYATSGTTLGVPNGDLYVSYDVTFKGALLNRGAMANLDNGYVIATANVNKINYGMGTSQTSFGGLAYSMTFTAGAGNGTNINFFGLTGPFIVQLLVNTGTGISPTTPPTVTALPSGQATVVPVFGPYINATGTQGVYCVLFVASNPNCTLLVDYSTWVGSMINSSLRVYCSQE